ncbi:MAG TPA: lysophospholipid acyltransferase family protein [Bellilinea sp.]|nr:lysophospholipid acyltransferase family protein [Bellilinea sp.]
MSDQKMNAESSDDTLEKEAARKKRNRVQRLIHWLIKTLTNTIFIGVENLPRVGGVIVATNHVSRLDIPVLFVNPARPDITALVANKYLNYPWFRWIAEAAGAIWLDRSQADFAAFSQSMEVLRSGKALGIAPEGTRSTTHALIEGKAGTVLLAQRSGLPVVPVGIAGSDTATPKMLTFGKPTITVVFGKPLTLPPVPRENRAEIMQQQTDEIMCRIAALLPESYRGVYANHLRTLELLANPELYR